LLGEENAPEEVDLLIEPLLPEYEDLLLYDLLFPDVKLLLVLEGLLLFIDVNLDEVLEFLVYEFLLVLLVEILCEAELLLPDLL